MEGHSQNPDLMNAPIINYIIGTLKMTTTATTTDLVV